LRLVHQLRDLDRLDPLDRYQAHMSAAVERLLAAGVDVLDVTQEVAGVNDALTGRLLQLAENHLGPPPFAYAWLALGSHGRGEQVLSSDQDSALAYGGPRLGDGDPDQYFGQLADVVVDGLARAGLPRCSGGYMATRWRYPLQRFVDLFGGWVDHPMPQALLQAEVFLDVRPVHGALPVDVLGDLLVTGGQRGTFSLQMARAAVSFRPPRVVLGRFRGDRGQLDVKRAGTAAIVLLARLYALAAGSTARSTLTRLPAAAEAGGLSRSGAADLVEAYRHLTTLRLRHQVCQVQRGEPADNLVRVGDLSQQDQGRLRAALHTVRVVQDLTANRYVTHTVT
jgi:CBS domain-containing protein